MIRPWFRHAAVPWKTTATQTRASGENRVSTKPGVLHIVKLTETLREWGCWDDDWSVPTSGGIAQAQQRLGDEPVKELFAQVAVPVADEDTPGAFLGPWRLMSIDGFEWDAPATPENIAAFGFAGTDKDDAAAFPRARVVMIGECCACRECRPRL